jgi:hypothetical protein
VPGPPLLHDLACVIHAHSRHSDGTGTIPQVAAAARRAGVDAVLITDHDTLAGLPEEGWYDSVLVLVGEEISPADRDHTLAFGLAHPVPHRGRDAAGICAAVAAAGGISFAAHPFSRGSEAFPRFGSGTPHTGLDAPDLTGLELWSFVTDSAESLTGVRQVAGFVASPGRFLTAPPQRNVDAWDRLCERRRLVAIGGVDAHQIGIRVGNRVPLRLMSYARSFGHLRTHVLCEQLPTGRLEDDRAQVLAALRDGRCYLAVDSVAPARGFAFWAESADGAVAAMGSEAPAGEWTLKARLPRPATLRLLTGGHEVSSADAAELDVTVREPGAYRVDARLGERAWILSNPVYLRA